MPASRRSATGAALARLRAVIRQADPGIVEEWTWHVPVWSCGGIVCTGETYNAAVKRPFAHGAALDDPASLFTASLAGAVRRAIDVREDVDAGGARPRGRGAERVALYFFLNESVSGTPTKPNALRSWFSM